MEIGDKVYEIAVKWDYFDKDTMGKQFVKAADSIAANISESFDRYHYSDTREFCYIARGSLFESKTWLTKAYRRELVSEDYYNQNKKLLDKLGIKFNNYINHLNKYISEPNVNYGVSDNVDDDIYDNQ